MYILFINIAHQTHINKTEKISMPSSSTLVHDQLMYSTNTAYTNSYTPEIQLDKTVCITDERL